MSEINEARRAVLRSVCDTVVPAIEHDPDPTGLWRRTALPEYRNAEPKWETVLDLDALASTENEN